MSKTELKKPEIKYDEVKAQRNFWLFKFAEVFGLFLFTVGFHGFGTLLWKYQESWWAIIPVFLFGPFDGSPTFVETWFLGFAGLMILIFLLGMLIGVGYIVGLIFISWIKLNQYWAKLSAEYPSDKEKRLKAEKEDRIAYQRKKYGMAEGDRVKYQGSNFRIKKGAKGTITNICSETIYADLDDYSNDKFYHSSLELVKKNVKKKRR